MSVSETKKLWKGDRFVEVEDKDREKASYKDYFFVSQACSLVITTDTEEEATDVLKETVRHPQAFCLSLVEPLQEQFTDLKCKLGREPTSHEIRKFLKSEG